MDPPKRWMFYGGFFVSACKTDFLTPRGEGIRKRRSRRSQFDELATTDSSAGGRLWPSFQRFLRRSVARIDDLCCAVNSHSHNCVHVTLMVVATSRERVLAFIALDFQNDVAGFASWRLHIGGSGSKHFGHRLGLGPYVQRSLRPSRV